MSEHKDTQPDSAPEGMITTPDTAEKMPDEARIIADKYIATIPHEEKVLGNKSSADMTLWLFEATEEWGGLSHTADRIGNAPQSILGPMEREDTEASVAAMRACAADPVDMYGREGDKIMSVQNSSLPPSVKRACLSVLLTEGKMNISNIWTEIADRIEDEKRKQQTDTITDPSMYGILRAVKEERGNEMKENDEMRMTALKYLLNAIYPTFMSSPEIAFMKSLRDKSFDLSQEATAWAFVLQAQTLCPTNETVQSISEEQIKIMKPFGRKMFIEGLRKTMLEELGRKFATPMAQA